MYFNKLKRRFLFIIYKCLCVIWDAFSKHPIVSKINNLIVSLLLRKHEAVVYVVIIGKGINRGFANFLTRKALVQNLLCLTRVREMGVVLEVVLRGNFEDIEFIISSAWKGSSKARVEQVRSNWLKKQSHVKLKADKIDSNLENIPWSQEVADLIIHTIDCLKPIIDKPNVFNEKSRFNNAVEVAEAAKEKKCYVQRHSQLNYIVSNTKQIGLSNTQSSRVSTIIRAITSNKHLTKQVLSKQGLPVPKGKTFTNLDLAKVYLKKFKPLVVKPVEGSFGFGVTVDVRTENDLVNAWKYAQKRHNTVVLEELIQGVDLRVIVVGGKAHTAMLRVPANVVGDGQRSIKELINEKNRQRALNPRHCKTPIICDFYTNKFLAKQGYKFNSIPPRGTIVFLHLKANIESGGDSIVVTDVIHPDLMTLAEEASAAFGINDFWGIDILAEYIDRPRNQQKCCIIEVNSRASIGGPRFPMYGKPTAIAPDYINYLFANKSQKATAQDIRIDVKGIINSPFYEMISSQAKKLAIKGYCEIEKEGVSIHLKTDRQNAFRYAERLWNWNEGGSFIDSLQIDTCGAMAPATRNRTYQLEDNFADWAINVYQLTEWDTSVDIDQQIFLKELQKHDYSGRLTGELIEIRKDTSVGFTGMYHSSIFCDEVCKRIYPARKILSFNGLPVSRGLRFKIRDKKRMEAYIQQYPGLKCITGLHPLEHKTHFVNSWQQFLAFYNQELKRGTSYILVEEAVTGMVVRIAVVVGKSLCSLALFPTSITGDGVSTFGELVEKKNNYRLKNPWYKNKIIETTKFSKQKLNEVICAGTKIYLEELTDLVYGGERIALNSVLHEDFMHKASQAVVAIPGLEFAVVQMIIPAPDKLASKQKWIIDKIDTRPSVSEFHFPWKGKPYRLVEKVVSKLCLTERTKWI